MQSSDREAEELYYKYEHYVPTTLKRSFPNYLEFAKIHGLEKNDLLQLGRIGLSKATKEYNPTKKTSFRTYAIKKIRFTIMTETKKYSLNNKTNRSYDLADKTSMEYPLATTDGDVVDLHDVVEASNDAFFYSEFEMGLEELSTKVSQQFVDAVRMKYNGSTYAEIGEEIGMSDQGVLKMLKKNRGILSDYLLA